MRELFVSTAYAATAVINSGKNGSGEDIAVEQIAVNIFNKTLLPAFMALSLGFVVYAGFLYITSQGDAEKVQRAHRALLWAVIGIVLVAFSVWIVVTLNKVINDTIY